MNGPTDRTDEPLRPAGLRALQEEREGRRRAERKTVIAADALRRMAAMAENTAALLDELVELDDDLDDEDYEEEETP